MAWLETTGVWTRKAVVVLAFIGVPLAIWWSASGMISNLGFSDSVRFLLTMSVFTTVAFGGASAFLVLRDLSIEP